MGLFKKTLWLGLEWQSRAWGIRLAWVKAFCLQFEPSHYKCSPESHQEWSMSMKPSTSEAPLHSHWNDFPHRTGNATAVMANVSRVPNCGSIPAPHGSPSTSECKSSRARQHHQVWSWVLRALPSSPGNPHLWKVWAAPSPHPAVNHGSRCWGRE